MGYKSRGFFFLLLMILGKQRSFGEAIQSRMGYEGHGQFRRMYQPHTASQKTEGNVQHRIPWKRGRPMV